MDRTGVPQTLLILLLLSSVCLSLYTMAPPVPPQITSPSDPVWELQDSVHSPPCNLTVEPQELVVRFGDPVSVNCSSPEQSYLGWTELPDPVSTGITTIGHFLLWTEESVSSFNVQPVCFTMSVVGQCQASVRVTVYQPPQSVFLSFQNQPGSLLEDTVYSLQCEVEAVAPVHCLIVRFYKGHSEMYVQRSTSEHKIPVSESFYWNYTVRREDHGTHFWCEATLELGSKGPEHPPVVRSQSITAIVHFNEEQVESPPTHSSRVNAGRATVSAQSQQRHPEKQGPRGAGHALCSSALLLLVLLSLHQ